MTFKEIQELIKLVGKSNLTEFKMKDGDLELTIRTKRYQKQQQVAAPTMMPVPAQLPPAYPPAAAAPAPAPAAAASPAPAKAEAPTEEGGNYLEVKSPMVGTFYRSSSPDKPAFVQVGDTISNGSVVCIVEAMKLFNEIESEVAGKVVKVLVEDAQPVEYDQVLFLVAPA